MRIEHPRFVTVFPEFSDGRVYPADRVGFWIDQAEIQVSDDVFGESSELAAMLFVAHNLALGGGSGSSGASVAPVTSKTVGPISKSFDTTVAAWEKAGIFNGTSYGQRLYALLRAHGSGPRYRPSFRSSPFRSPGAWPYLR